MKNVEGLHQDSAQLGEPSGQESNIRPDSFLCQGIKKEILVIFGESDSLFSRLSRFRECVTPLPLFSQDIPFPFAN